MKKLNRSGWTAAALLALAALFPPQVLAQMPARFYWKNLSGGNAVPVLFSSLSGNTNPFDPSHNVKVDGTVDTSLLMTGWAHTFALGDRAAVGAIILPMGRISSGVGAVTETANGYGDPMLEFTYNLIGPKALRNIPDVQRYEPGFSLDVLFDLALPIGEYDNTKSVNLGQNRWYGRIGAPIVWQLGDWVPSRRTTLEFLPAVWLFGDNNDFTGKKLKTDPMFQLDAHLTRDFTKDLWGALDVVWYNGSGSTLGGVSIEKINNVGAGFTLGYTVNDNIGLTVGYKSTVNDSKPSDMRMDSFMVSLVFGWHPLIEGMKRLKNE
jgi:Putative MetA-pathway of phenol degradation